MSRNENTTKKTVVHKPGHGKRFWMSKAEYTDLIVGKEASGVYL